MKPEACLVLTTFPDTRTARRILDQLLTERLAACVQRLPVRSSFHWKGKLTRAAEVLAVIKTRRALYPAVAARLRSLHPYETPEIILLPIAAGAAGYLGWIDAETRPAAKS